MGMYGDMDATLKTVLAKDLGFADNCLPTIPNTA